MAAPDPLSELADIHLPEAVGAWPPAFGWWLLLVLVLLGLYVATQKSLTLISRRRHLKSALDELDAYYRQFREHSAFERSRNQAGLDFLGKVNSLLRRVALIRYPDQKIAHLSGKAWLEFLDHCDGSKNFSRGPGYCLGRGVYQKQFKADSRQLYKLARRWVENCYREQKPTRKKVREVPA